MTLQKCPQEMIIARCRSTGRCRRRCLEHHQLQGIISRLYWLRALESVASVQIDENSLPQHLSAAGPWCFRGGFWLYEGSAECDCLLVSQSADHAGHGWLLTQWQTQRLTAFLWGRCAVYYLCRPRLPRTGRTAHHRCRPACNARIRDQSWRI